MVDGVKPGFQPEGKSLQLPLPLVANLVFDDHDDDSDDGEEKERDEKMKARLSANLVITLTIN